jgi:outer membrane lipoprotein-sorting protein
MKTIKDIKKLILTQQIKTDQRTRDKILSGAFAQLDAVADTNRHSQPFSFYQVLLHNRVAHFATVAGIIFAIFITVHFAGKPITVCSVAVAQVIEKIDNVHTFTYRYYQQILNGEANHKGQTETVYYVSPDYGVRLGTYVDGKTEEQTFLLPAEKVKITVIPEEKQYKRDELTGQTFGLAQQEDPRKLIRQFLSSKYTDLGCAVISGIECRGIELSNPGFMQDSMKNVVGRLWVNIKTQLPVRMELEGIDLATSKRVEIVTDEFRWDADLQKDDFGPFIPEDYVLEEDNDKK